MKSSTASPARTINPQQYMRNPPVTAQSPKDIAMKKWTKHALTFIGTINGKSAATSPPYLQAALKIAKCLTEQIIQAEKLERQYGISHKLDVLPISKGHDWAKYVLIRLERESPLFHVDEAQYEAAHAEEATSKLSVAQAEIARNLNEPLRSIEGGGALLQNQARAQSTTAEENLDDELTSFLRDEDILDRQLTSFLQTFSVDDFEKADAAEQSEREREELIQKYQSNPARAPSPAVPNYLNVDTAEIVCPESERSSIHNGDDAVQESKRRVYYLGLVLYELFSGGEAPPASLYALAKQRGAFVSLPISTLVEQRERGIQSSFHEGHKCVQGSSKCDKDGLCHVYCEYLRLIGIHSSLCGLVFDMLSCVYGDLAGRESYTDIHEVLSDLKLMMDRPKFLARLRHE
jgi:hypothetical protein